MDKQKSKITEKEILKDKKTFDSLSLEKKLEFWDEKGINWYQSEFPSEMERISSNKTQVFLSIVVAYNSQSNYNINKQEHSIINKWRLNHYLTDVPEADPKRVIAKCIEKITNNPQRLRYLERELRYQEELFAELDSDEEEDSMSLHYFRNGFESVVQKEELGLDNSSEYFVLHLKDYCNGIVCAHYIQFLKNEIERIGSEEKGIDSKDVLSPEDILSISHKLIILESLGITGKLKADFKYPLNMNGADFARLIAIIIDEYSKPKIDTIRKGISQYRSGGDNDPLTDKGKHAAKIALTKAGVYNQSMNLD